MHTFDKSPPLRRPILWVLYFLALLALRGVATYSPSARLWGLDSLADMGDLPLLAIPLFLLALSKGVAGRLARALHRLLQAPKVWLFAFATGAGVVFALLRSRNFLLGDSLLYVHALQEGIQIESAGRREAGATLVVSALHWSLRKVIPAGSETTFVVASVVAGVIYVVLAAAVAKLLCRGTPAQALVFASLLGAGSLQIFFGHAEYYSLVAASGMLYAYLSLRWLRGKGNLAVPALGLAFAVFVHVMNALLAISFLWLVFVALRRGRKKEALVASSLVPAVLLTAAAIISYPYGSFIAIFERGKHMLPFSFVYDPDYYAYSVFDPAHLREVANELLLTVPLLPLLALAALRRQRAGQGEEVPDSGAARQSTWGVGPPGGFIATVALGAGLFALLANPALGMARDWDIFAFPFLLLALAAGYAAACKWNGSPQAVWLCGALILTGGIHLALFVIQNRTPSAYVPRFRRIALQEEVFAPTPRAELWRYLGWEALKVRDSDQAREDLLRSVRDHPTQVKAYRMLAVIEIGKEFDWLASRAGADRRRALGLDTEQKLTAEAARLGLNRYYSTIAEQAPNKVRALIGAGIAAINVGAPDTLVVEAFRKAYEADPEDLEARAFWGDILRAHGDYAEAQKQYDWVLARRRWQIRAFIGRACLYGVRGQPDTALEMVRELRRHYPWSIEAQQFLNAWKRGLLATPEDFRTFLITQ